MATSRSSPCSVNAADPDVVIVVRTTRRRRRARRRTTPARRATAATTSAPRRQCRDAPPQRSAWQRRCRCRAGWPRARLAACSSTNSAVEMSATRCRRSFSRQPLQQRANRRRHLRRERRPVRLALQHIRERVGDVFAVERTLARQHLVEHAPERPDVAALVGRACPSPAPAPCTRPCPGSCRRRSSSRAS